MDINQPAARFSTRWQLSQHSFERSNERQWLVQKYMVLRISHGYGGKVTHDEAAQVG